MKKFLDINNENIEMERDIKSYANVMEAIDQMVEAIDGMTVNETMNAVTRVMAFVFLASKMPKEEAERGLRHMSLAILHHAYDAGEVKEIQ